MKHWKSQREHYEKEESDSLESQSRETGIPPAPSGEFENIMAEMERRGIEPRIRGELKSLKNSAR
ncbi:MAG: hypothetical protein QM657_19430 [Lacrimispora sp.]|uniref:hypothetical protein n=1 Tax=Lacrimispora sp. TaxID=2719234 RepID=UPI0039E25B5E